MRIVVFQVRFYRCPEVSVREILQHRNALVHIHIVEHKIGESIKEDADAQAQEVAVWVNYPEVDKQDAGNGKNHRENIVPLNFTSIADVMVFVQHPQKSMHYIFMGKPGHKFHKKKCCDYQHDIQKKFHCHLAIDMLNSLLHFNFPTI